MIEDLDRRGTLGGLNHNQIRDNFQGFKYEITNEIGEDNRWELTGNYPIFTMVMVIYHYVVIIGEFSLHPIFHMTYMIIKNIIKMNQLLYIYLLRSFLK